MAYITAVITWPSDERRIAIEGRMSAKAFEYLRDQLQEDRELINIAGIRPVCVQAGLKNEDFAEERTAAEAVEDVSDIFDAIDDVVDDDDDDDFDPDSPDFKEVDVATENEVLDFVMPFGKHSGKTLWQIACEAPKYLDWCAGEFNGTRDVDKMIQAVVKIPAVAKKIDNAVF